jgi:hypothetical protein
MSASVAYSPFIRHKRIHFFIIDFRICTAEVHKFGMYRAVQEEAEGMQRACRLEAPLHKRVFRKGCGPSRHHFLIYSCQQMYRVILLCPTSCASVAQFPKHDPGLPER